MKLFSMRTLFLVMAIVVWPFLWGVGVTLWVHELIHHDSFWKCVIDSVNIGTLVYGTINLLNTHRSIKNLDRLFDTKSTSEYFLTILRKGEKHENE